jgi:hypothetical protein
MLQTGPRPIEFRTLPGLILERHFDAYLFDYLKHFLTTCGNGMELEATWIDYGRTEWRIVDTQVKVVLQRCRSLRNKRK